MELIPILSIIFSIPPLGVFIYFLITMKAEQETTFYFVFLFIWTLLIGVAVFSIPFIYRHYFKKTSTDNIAVSRYISSRINKNIDIVFKKIGRDWFFKKDDKYIPFYLKGLIFKKKYLMAFATRSVRYPIISKRLPIKTIYRRNLSMYNPSIEMNVLFINKESIIKKTLVKKGKSKCGFVEQLIIYSKFPFSIAPHQNIIIAIKYQIIHFNEERYINGL